LEIYYIFTYVNSFKRWFVVGILRLLNWFAVDVFAFKLSFVADILAFRGLETVWATFFEKLGDFFKIFWSPWLQ